MRFYKKRQAAGEADKHQFVSLSDSDVNFGAGPGACPGRFLVSYELKLVVSFILLNYDLKMDESSVDALSTDGYGHVPRANVLLRVKQTK